MPHKMPHRLMCLVWNLSGWKLATQCHCCTLKDQVLLIAKFNAIQLAHPLMSRPARLAAIILQQPITPRTKT